MSVKVTIGHYPGQSFSRELIISRVSNVGIQRNDIGFDIADMVSEYEVVLNNGTHSDGTTRQQGVAFFPHRYGDDLLVLVTEAIAALGGVLPESKARRVAS